MKILKLQHFTELVQQEKCFIVFVIFRGKLYFNYVRFILDMCEPGEETHGKILSEPLKKKKKKHENPKI